MQYVAFLGSPQKRFERGDHHFVRHFSTSSQAGEQWLATYLNGMFSTWSLYRVEDDRLVYAGHGYGGELGDLHKEDRWFRTALAAWSDPTRLYINWVELD